MVIVMLITAVETTGDVFACADIVEKAVGGERRGSCNPGRRPVDDLGGILNSFPYTCFAENVGLVRLTKVKSRYVVATAGLFMMIIGVFPKVGAIVAAIPPPVLGGAASRSSAPLPWSGSRPCAGWTSTRRATSSSSAMSLGMAITPTVYPTISTGSARAYERSSPAASRWERSPPSCSTCSSTCGAATTTW